MLQAERFEDHPGIQEGYLADKNSAEAKRLLATRFWMQAQNTANSIALSKPQRARKS